VFVLVYDHIDITGISIFGSPLRGLSFKIPSPTSSESSSHSPYFLTPHKLEIFTRILRRLRRSQSRHFEISYGSRHHSSNQSRTDYNLTPHIFTFILHYINLDPHHIVQHLTIYFIAISQTNNERYLPFRCRMRRSIRSLLRSAPTSENFDVASPIWIHIRLRCITDVTEKKQHNVDLSTLTLPTLESIAEYSDAKRAMQNSSKLLLTLFR